MPSKAQPIRHTIHTFMTIQTPSQKQSCHIARGPKVLRTELVPIPVFFLSQVSTKRSEREREKGRKPTENEFFPTIIFRFLLVENIFWSQNLFTGIILLCILGT